jgi:glycosyltransferase involved in cell wall biosynthesis
MNSPCFHIAHILPFSSVGGTEIATLRIAQGLRREPFEHTAFCIAGTTQPEKLFADAGFETASFEEVQPSYRHPRAFLAASFRLARELKQRGVSLVHCADVLAAHFTAFAGMLAGLPVICHVRNRHDRISRRDRSFLYPVDRFLFVSQETRRNFAVRVPPGRGAVVYDGIDIAEVDREEARQRVQHEFNIPAGVKLIGMVARVAPQKDYPTLAKAAARLLAVRRDVRFLIVGDHTQPETTRSHYEKVRALLDERGLAPWFTFTGFQENTARLIAAFDLFVLCTHAEGFPLVLLEAMAQARPVIATSVDGVPEIVIDNETGLLHQHEDDAELARQILALIEDESLAARLGDAGYRFVKTNFSFQRFIADMADQYLEMLEGRRWIWRDRQPSGELKEAKEGGVK